MTKSEKKEQEKVSSEDKNPSKKNEQKEKKSSSIKEETLEELETETPGRQRQFSLTISERLGEGWRCSLNCQPLICHNLTA